jgi:RHS repeat-associated protein
MHRSFLQPLSQLREYSPFYAALDIRENEWLAMRTLSVWTEFQFARNAHKQFDNTLVEGLVVLEGRTYTAESGYRYGFNGKEKDDEGMGGGGQTYDYGFRIYNPSLARFLSVDPLVNLFSFYSPYHYAGNSAIACSDKDGCEPELEIQYWNAMATDVVINNSNMTSFTINGYRVIEAVIEHMGVVHYAYAYFNKETRLDYWESFIPEGLTSTEGMSFDINNESFFLFQENPNPFLYATSYTTYMNGYGFGEGSDDGAMRGHFYGEEGWNNGGKQVLFGTIGVILSGGTLAAAEIGIGALLWETGGLALSVDDITMGIYADGKTSFLTDKLHISTGVLEKLKFAGDVTNFVSGLYSALKSSADALEFAAKNGGISNEEIEVLEGTKLMMDQLKVIMGGADLLKSEDK